MPELEEEKAIAANHSSLASQGSFSFITAVGTANGKRPATHFAQLPSLSGRRRSELEGSKGFLTARSDPGPGLGNGFATPRVVTPRRRYFVKKDPPVPPGFATLGHFDIRIKEGPQYTNETEPFAPSTSFLRLYYCDFLAAEPAVPVSVNQHGEIDIEALQQWLERAEPRDRTQAYPLLVLTKALLTNIVEKRNKIISHRLRDVEDQLREANEALALEKAKTAPLEQQLHWCAEKIIRKRTRSKVQKSLIEKLQHMSKDLQLQVETLQSTNDRFSADLQAQLNALRNVHEAERRSIESRYMRQQEAMAEELTNLRQQMFRHEEAIKKLQMEKTNLSQTFSGAYDLNALRRLSPDKFESLMAVVLSNEVLWETLDVNQKAGIGQATADSVRKLLVTNLLKKWLGTSTENSLAQATSVDFEQIIMEAFDWMNDATKVSLLRRILSQTSLESLREVSKELYRLTVRGQHSLYLIPFLGACSGMEDMKVAEHLKVELQRLIDHSESSCWIDHTNRKWGDEESALPRDRKKPELKKVPGLDFDASVKPMALSAARTMINKIYADKLIADSKCDSAGRPRRAFKDFIAEFNLRQCGLKSMANKNFNALCSAVLKFSDQNKDITLFGEMVGILDSGYFVPTLLDVGLLGLSTLLVGEDMHILSNEPEQCSVLLEDAKSTLIEVFNSKFGFGADIFSEQSSVLLNLEPMQTASDQADGTINLYTFLLHIMRSYRNLHEIVQRGMTLFFQESDVNGDGVFDFEEFEKMMHSALDGYGVLDDDPVTPHTAGSVTVMELYQRCLNTEDDDDDTIAPETIAATLQSVLTTACPLSYFLKARDAPAEDVSATKDEKTNLEPDPITSSE